MRALTSARSPSSRILKVHFLYGAQVLLVAMVLIAIFPEAFTQHYFNPKLLGITHLLVLGWITMIIMGVLYQLIPVILEATLHSESLSYYSFSFLALGTLLIGFSFWNFWLGWSMYLGALLVLIAVLAFMVNLYQTVRKSETKGIETDFIQTASNWLLFTVLIGTFLAFNLRYALLDQPHIELLKLHAHAGLAGWVLQLIIGVAIKLFPMFLITDHKDPKGLTRCYYFLNIGLITGLVALFYDFKWILWAGIAIVGIGVWYFLRYVYSVFKSRIKKRLDSGMKQSMIAFIPLAVVLPIVIYLQLDSTSSMVLPSATIYGSLLVFGFISMLILGQTMKILPFIIWLKEYGERPPKAGKRKVFPRDLFSHHLARVQMWVFISGLVFLLCGTLLRTEMVVSVAGVILALAVLLYDYQVVSLILHKNREVE